MPTPIYDENQIGRAGDAAEDTEIQYMVYGQPWSGWEECITIADDKEEALQYAKLTTKLNIGKYSSVYVKEVDGDCEVLSITEFTYDEDENKVVEA